MKTWLILSACFLLSSCGSQRSDVKAELEALTKDLQGKVNPIPQLAPIEAFKYEASGMPDPFQPSKAVAGRK